MPTRRNSRRRGSLDAALAALPDRFTEVEVRAEDGQLTGLREYMRDLTEYLRQETGSDEVPTVAAMEALGIPPSE